MCNMREFWWLNICLQSFSSPWLPLSKEEQGSATLKTRFASVRSGLRAGKKVQRGGIVLVNGRQRCSEVSA